METPEMSYPFRAWHRFSLPDPSELDDAKDSERRWAHAAFKALDLMTRCRVQPRLRRSGARTLGKKEYDSADLGPEACQVLLCALDHIARGRPVAVFDRNIPITSQQAAVVLGCSRPAARKFLVDEFAQKSPADPKALFLIGARRNPRHRADEEDAAEARSPYVRVAVDALLRWKAARDGRPDPSLGLPEVGPDDLDDDEESQDVAAPEATREDGLDAGLSFALRNLRIGDEDDAPYLLSDSGEVSRDEAWDGDWDAAPTVEEMNASFALDLLRDGLRAEREEWLKADPIRLVCDVKNESHAAHDLSAPLGWRVGRVLESILSILVNGDHPVAIALDHTVSTKEAAEILGSYPKHVARLIDKGALPAVRVPGTVVLRLRLEDVLAFQRRAQDDPALAGPRRPALDAAKALASGLVLGEFPPKKDFGSDRRSVRGAKKEPSEASLPVPASSDRRKRSVDALLPRLAAPLVEAGKVAPTVGLRPTRPCKVKRDESRLVKSRDGLMRRYVPKDGH